MSYGSRLKRELGLKCPQLISLAEAALSEAGRLGAIGADKPPRIPLADKILEAMERERRDHGSIVAMRLDGQGWSAHILDPEEGGISSAGCEDPELAWEAVQARRVEKAIAAQEQRILRDARAAEATP